MVKYYSFSIQSHILNYEKEGFIDKSNYLLFIDV